MQKRGSLKKHRYLKIYKSIILTLLTLMLKMIFFINFLKLSQIYTLIILTDLQLLISRMFR